MAFRFILVGISLAIIILIFDVLLPKLKLKYRLYKELKIKKCRQKINQKVIKCGNIKRKHN